MHAALVLLVLSSFGADEVSAPAPCPVGPEASETWRLTLPEAISIGLGNSEILRVISSKTPSPATANCRAVRDTKGVDGDAACEVVSVRREAPRFLSCRAESRDESILILPIAGTPGFSSHRFQSELMAHLRSIEQQYWTLAQRQAQHWGATKACELAEEIKCRAEADLKLGRGTVAEVEEATRRLEQFRLQVVSKTSDVITAERQLRGILGLPPADSRRIVPATAPAEAELNPDWDQCLATMLRSQPDIAQQRAIVGSTALRLLSAQGADLLASVLDPPSTCASPKADAEKAQAAFKKQEAYLDQVVHQTTHSLARFFLELDANYKQFKIASRLRAAAAQQLEAQRTSYEEGRITIDRYLDTVAQYADAVAQEAQFKASYNISIVALEEAKGTLLAYNNIAVADAPRPKADSPCEARAEDVASHPAPRPAVDPEVEKTGGVASESGDSTAGCCAARDPKAAPTTTVKFDITVGTARPFQVRGTLSITRDGASPAGTDATPARP